MKPTEVLSDTPEPNTDRQRHVCNECLENWSARVVVQPGDHGTPRGYCLECYAETFPAGTVIVDD